MNIAALLAQDPNVAPAFAAQFAGRTLNPNTMCFEFCDGSGSVVAAEVAQSVEEFAHGTAGQGLLGDGQGAMVLGAIAKATGAAA